MVYDRRYDDRELRFEASGALLHASLVMRDRETDSWWSIMSSSAIGGELQGAELRELPVSEKTTWGAWRRRHPDTLVLSVDGAEHADRNPYDDYLASEKTFRDLESDDRRLAPKTPIYAFLHAGRAWAAPHGAIEGGRLFDDEAFGGRRLLLYRREGAPLLASTGAWLVPAATAAADDPTELARALDRGALDGAEPVEGFDTFWYTWAAVQRDSRLLGE